MTCRWDAHWYPVRPARVASDPNMRVSDAERNQVAEKLSQHYADGRLDPGEFKERLDHAMGAKTRGDLSGLMTDLPPLAPPASQTPPHHHRGRAALWFLLGALLVAWYLPWPGAHWLWVSPVPWILALVAFLAWRRSRHRHHDQTVPSG
ncbi:MAG TPA: DUF1707 domain-containing protein [Acidimicrobiales bacterium]|nr:DUF1707 domain-containing protein [Acidimicrobiales bacterium]